MLNWLKRILSPQPAIRKVTELEARLAAPDGTRELYGDVEFDDYEDGSWKLEIDIEHPVTPPVGPLEVRFDGLPVKSFDVSGGQETEIVYRSSNSELAKLPVTGMKVEVFGATGLLLAGSFVVDH